MLSKYKVLKSHGVQYIKDLDAVVLSEKFRGRCVLTAGVPENEARRAENLCPTGAFSSDPFAIDLGKCCFCGECARQAPAHVIFTNDYRMGSTRRNDLIVTPGSPDLIPFDADAVRSQLRSFFGRALKLREVSAGGDNSTEMELNASTNVNFDIGRYGIEFVASPRHADGIVVTGPVTRNMAYALDICYCSVAEPKIIIAAGCDAISGGIFAGSPALDRSFFGKYTPDLYLPGNPVHPMTFIDGVIRLINRKK